MTPEEFMVQFHQKWDPILKAQGVGLPQRPEVHSPVDILAPLGQFADAYIRHGQITTTFYFLMYLAMVAILVWAGKACMRKEHEALGWMIYMAAFALALQVFTVGAVDLYTVWLAPEIWLLQEMARLMK